MRWSGGQKDTGVFHRHVVPYVIAVDLYRHAFWPDPSPDTLSRASTDQRHVSYKPAAVRDLSWPAV